ncbi:MAG TPA: hypothetical protein PLM53_09765 [Spirochaetota bacterium]|nr:hypothetical protein [Spirochaetota bacterium]HPC40911.1 hypothetical protein [Spirochaetota bacterium]HPL16038.1 hypothetical protein [Spirochaetota bacterium]HQF08659.1 hypothetical protein [Spirochaetota bacterium]HQH97374.1 hypothetical protein [Spirochaetota bacterium]
MKSLSRIVVAAAVLFSMLVLISLSASSAKKKDRNCLNRCAADYRYCLKKAKDYNYKERISAGNVCIKEKNTCVGLCPDAMVFRKNTPD